MFAEDDAQIAKLRLQREHLPDLIRVVTFDGESDGEWVLSLADLEALGARHLAEHPTCGRRAPSPRCGPSTWRP